MSLATDEAEKKKTKEKFVCSEESSLKQNSSKSRQLF